MVLIYEPHHKKTCLRGLRPGKTQTGLLSYRETSWSLESLDLERLGIIPSGQQATKVLIRMRGCAG